MKSIEPKYVVVTPVRDEDQFLPLTIESMTRQTILPTEWVIVDDGSKDSTGEIIDEAARQYPWIRAVHRQDRGSRQWGAGIIEAFYDGFKALTFHEWEFMSKMDGDLSFAPEYFENALAKFRLNPRLGIGGGYLYHMVDGKPVVEQHPVFHVRGGAKIYRRECWDAMGGLWVGPGSDTLDDVKANMLGWTSESFIDIQIRHHRWTGEAYGRWGGLAKNGKTDYVSGYHPLFLMVKALKRLVQRPYIMGSCALLYGYLEALFKRMPQVNDPDLIKYLRRQQLARLYGGETIWK
jgi:glycosyltransferase involved in cell wall biosynthesis